MKVVLAETAEDDLEAIANWIAKDNPGRALSFAQELRARCRSLGDHPRAFPLLARHRVRGIRRRVYGNYLIFYRIDPQQVSILHIIHGARDYEQLLFPDEGLSDGE